MQLVFSGTSGEDVTAYLRRVQLEALQQGCPDDNALIVDLVTASLEGAALRWFCEQEEDVQEDWKKLRRAMLCHYKDVPTQLDPPSSTGSAPAKVVHAAPHLTTATVSVSLYLMSLQYSLTASSCPFQASNLAATAWSSSKSQGCAGIRLYKPGKGCIDEICNAGTQFDALAWSLGARLVPPISISDTAPIAAANSFGLHEQAERIAVYYVSRNNHLRAFQYDGSWVEGGLDVPLEGICTELTAECRVCAGKRSICQPPE